MYIYICVYVKMENKSCISNYNKLYIKYYILQIINFNYKLPNYKLQIITKGQNVCVCVCKNGIQIL